MSDTAHYDAIHTVEQLAAQQHLHYSFENGLVTFHTPDGDKTFNWLETSGIPNTLQWLEGRKIQMSDLENISQTLQRQYSGLYGQFQAGDYPVGSTVSVPGTTGQVIWSFRSASGMTYVVDDGSGFPVEVKAYEVREVK